jgi:hypothetical protein
VIVTVVVVVTGEVLTANAPLDARPLTTTVDGTCRTAGLLLASWTSAPSVAPVNVTVPVAALPPVSDDGVADTELSEGPAGVAALTERLAVRGTFWTAAVSWTMVGGAAALVAIGKLAEVAPAGTTTLAGTVATERSPLKSRTVVGSGSGNARLTVPTEDAPSRTRSGETESDEITPAAEAAPGNTSSIDSVSSRVRRRMRTPGRNAMVAITAVTPPRFDLLQTQRSAAGQAIR